MAEKREEIKLKQHYMHHQIKKEKQKEIVSYPWICCLDTARQESQSIGQVTYSKGLETPEI